VWQVLTLDIDSLMGSFWRIPVRGCPFNFTIPFWSSTKPEGLRVVIFLLLGHFSLFLAFACLFVTSMCPNHFVMPNFHYLHIRINGHCYLLPSQHSCYNIYMLHSMLIQNLLLHHHNGILLSGLISKHTLLNRTTRYHKVYRLKFIQSENYHYYSG
jgi:hypothetical protein